MGSSLFRQEYYCDWSSMADNQFFPSHLVDAAFADSTVEPLFAPRILNV